MNSDVCVVAKTAQRPSTVYCFACIVHEDHTLWADEADQKYADAMETNDDNKDDLDNDTVYCVNSNLHQLFFAVILTHL